MSLMRSSTNRIPRDVPTLRVRRGPQYGAPFRCFFEAGQVNMDNLLMEALEALKDILNASANGQPYATEELERMVTPILSEAYSRGIRLDGEKV